MRHRGLPSVCDVCGGDALASNVRFANLALGLDPSNWWTCARLGLTWSERDAAAPCFLKSILYIDFSQHAIAAEMSPLARPPSTREEEGPFCVNPNARKPLVNDRFRTAGLEVLTRKHSR
jgi:hypothetical protein